MRLLPSVEHGKYLSDVQKDKDFQHVPYQTMADVRMGTIPQILGKHQV